jgi:hypothetical protein
MNLGVLMHWFPPEGTTHNEVSIFSSLWSVKHIYACWHTLARTL